VGSATLRGLVIALVALCVQDAGGQERARPPVAPVTKPQGGSWLRILAITVDTTQIGHMGGAGTPAESEDAPEFHALVHRIVALAGTREAAARTSLEVAFTAGGADIYRLNCRSCHGPRGHGAAPEVASIVGVAGALSPAVIERNVVARTGRVRPDVAQQLAEQTERLVRERLRDGGKAMPPFRHLSEPEIEALLEYLKELGGAPAPTLRKMRTPESVARIGEHVVQGTCRICHDATGPGAGHMMMMAGRIPALASIPDEVSLEAVVHKVRHGWSEMTSMAHQMSRMPIFSYISEEEVAAAYVYLAYYPAAP
jgi:mono/diheme cytochrome c family protein